MFWPSLSCPAISLAIASWSPVTILMSTPMLADRRDGFRAIVARRIEQRQQAEEAPLAGLVGARDAEGAEPLRPRPIDARRDRLRAAPRSADRGRRITCGAPLATLKRRLRARRPPRPASTPDRRDGNRRSCSHRGSLPGSPSRIAASMASGASRCDASRAASRRSSRGHIRRRLRVAQRQLVLGQRAGLVAAQHVHAGHLFDRDEARDDRLQFRQSVRRRSPW